MAKEKTAKVQAKENAKKDKKARAPHFERAHYDSTPNIDPMDVACALGVLCGG